jgi:Ca-activated chloride channel family protein
VLTNVKVSFEGLDAYDVEPMQLPDVLGGRPVVVFGKWKGDTTHAKVIVDGQTAGGPYRIEMSTAGQEDAKSSALRLLWARLRIAALSDQEALEGGSTQKETITALGLKYGLLTQYTSFIAVDKIVRNSNPAQSATVDQPSPLPEGVSEAAIGAEVPSTPEPGAWIALLLVAGIVAATLASRRPK